MGWFPCRSCRGSERCSNCINCTTPKRIKITVPAGTYATTNCIINCSAGEGVFVADQNLAVSPCVWQSPDVFVCTDGVSSTTYKYQIDFVLFNTVVVRFQPTNAAITATPTFSKIISPIPFDCRFSGLVLTFVSNNNPGDPQCVSSAGKFVTLDLP